MTKIKSILLAAGCVAVMSLSTGNLAAQGPRNFDPAQMRERMVSRYKDAMEVTDDAEWKVLEAAIGKVVDARFEAMQGQFGGFRGQRAITTRTTPTELKADSAVAAVSARPARNRKTCKRRLMTKRRRTKSRRSSPSCAKAIPPRKRS